MNKILTATILSFGFFSSLAFAQSKGIAAEALKYVANGKVVAQEHDEIKIQTPNGGIIEVEFTNQGAFEEASGKDASADSFTPPNDLVPLSQALAGLKKAGKEASGDWSLDYSRNTGWYYEFEGFENNQEMEYIVDAKTGKFLSSNVD